MNTLQDANCLRRINIFTVFLSCLVWPAYALKFTVENSRDGSEIFIKCEYATLKCIHESYANLQSWKYDSREVAKCLFNSCEIKENISGFTFDFDTTNGIFIWTIDPITDEYEDKLFECSDGTITNTLRKTVPFDEDGWKSQNFAIFIALVIFVNILAVIGTIAYHREILCSEQPKRNQPISPDITDAVQTMQYDITTNDGADASRKVRSNWCQTFLVLWFPLVFFIVGFFLTFSLVLATRFNNGSVLEEYVKICCWKILLILLGIYVLIPGVPLLILVILIKRTFDSKTGLSPVQIHIQRQLEAIDISINVTTNDPKLFTTVCFYTDGNITGLTDEDTNNRRLLKQHISPDLRQSSMPWHIRQPKSACTPIYPRWIYEDAYCRVFKAPTSYHYGVEKSSTVKLFVYWTAMNDECLAISEDNDYIEAINTKNKFDIHPKRLIQDDNTTPL